MVTWPPTPPAIRYSLSSITTAAWFRPDAERKCISKRARAYDQFIRLASSLRYKCLLAFGMRARTPVACQFQVSERHVWNLGIIPVQYARTIQLNTSKQNHLCNSQSIDQNILLVSRRGYPAHSIHQKYSFTANGMKMYNYVQAERPILVEGKHAFNNKHGIFTERMVKRHFKFEGRANKCESI